MMKSQLLSELLSVDQWMRPKWSLICWLCQLFVLMLAGRKLLKNIIFCSETDKDYRYVRIRPMTILCLNVESKVQ